MKEPVNLRVEYHPYPHLRDDEGCVLARDYVNVEKMDYVLAAVVAHKARVDDAELLAHDPLI